MIGAPGLGAVGRTGIALGELVGSLKHYLDRNMSFIFGENLLAEIIFKVLADYKHYFAKSGLYGIID